MDYFSITDQGMRNRRKDVLTAERARIENINPDNYFVTISYKVMDNYCMMKMETITLIVGRDTVIGSQFGQPLNFRELREGMIVDAEFSAVMTRSIPPQSRAFRIIVIDENTGSNFTYETVMDVDTNYGLLYTGNPNDIYSQMRFVITDATSIIDRSGKRISLRDLRPGDYVRVEHAVFQTASIPPQTTAFKVQVL